MNISAKDAITTLKSRAVSPPCACGARYCMGDHKPDLTGLDDGPYLPGQAPRKKAAPKSRETMAAIESAGAAVVPVEPTEAMSDGCRGALKAIIEAVSGDQHHLQGWKHTIHGWRIPPYKKMRCRWLAMLKASPFAKEPT